MIHYLYWPSSSLRPYSGCSDVKIPRAHNALLGLLTGAALVPLQDTCSFFLLSPPQHLVILFCIASSVTEAQWSSSAVHIGSHLFPGSCVKYISILVLYPPTLHTISASLGEYVCGSRLRVECLGHYRVFSLLASIFSMLPSTSVTRSWSEPLYYHSLGVTSSDSRLPPEWRRSGFLASIELSLHSCIDMRFVRRKCGAGPPVSVTQVTPEHAT